MNTTDTPFVSYYGTKSANHAVTLLQRKLDAETLPGPLFDDLDRLRAIPQRIVNVFNALRDTLFALEQDERLSPTAKTDDRKEAEARALSTIESLEAQAETYLGRERRRVNPAPLPREANDRIAAQMEADTLWRRMREQLDAGVPSADVIQAATLTGCEVLEAELPSYLRIHHPNGPEVAEGLFKGAQALIEQRRYVLMPEADYKARLAKKKAMEELAIGENNIKTTLAHIRYHIEEGNFGGFVVPDWPKGMVIRPAPGVDGIGPAAKYRG